MLVSGADPEILIRGRIEVPKAPTGWVWGGGVPLPRKKVWILHLKCRLLVHSGRYLLQFGCTFYT